METMENVYSHSKMAHHKNKLESLANGKITSPIYVRIKPTNKCNHRCFYCSYDPQFKYILSEKKNALDEIPEEKMMEILDDFKEMGVKAVTYSGGGEPEIYPHIIKTFEKTLDYGIELSIITNGQNLNGRKAELLANSEWVRISADYFNKDLFVKHRRVKGGLFDVLEKNIRDFSKIKKEDCELGINFLVTHLNFNSLYESARFFKDLGVNHIRFFPIYIPKGNKLSLEGSSNYHSESKVIISEQMSKIKDLASEKFKVFDFCEIDLGSVMVSERPYSRCFMMETVPVIAANQNVYFCHDKAYSNSGLLGSIKNQSFRELWFSSEAEKIFKNFKPKESCRHHCAADGRNLNIREMINNLDNLEKFYPETDKHKNFI